jgi:cyclophilin family peptidyl-prolyl cis-trans isomerase
MSSLCSISPRPFTVFFVFPIIVSLLVLTRGVQAEDRSVDDASSLLTLAEKSDYKATSRHADVMQFCERLAKKSPLVRMSQLGTSSEGRAIPMLILADPPIATAEEATKSKKLVVLVNGNIHAGEVDGKEALMMLARDLALDKEDPLLKDLIVVFVPIFNADGNEKFGKTNRPGQAGPEEVGIRANAQGLDLNRDYIKLESPEVRAMVRAFNEWDPAVFVDCHTTNGSFHRYAITYEGGRCPAGDKDIISFVSDDMLPELSKRLNKEEVRSFYYGDFSDDHTRWETVSAVPRYGTHYAGLRNRISILSESYTYAPFKERVLAGRAFVKNILEYTRENKDKIRKLLEDARNATVKAGTDLKDTGRIALQFKNVEHGRPVELLGFVEETRDGKIINTGKPKSYEVTYWGGTETTLSVQLPFAYLIPASQAKAVENLQRHGISVLELLEERQLDVEAYKVDTITARTIYQKHQPVTLKVTPRKEKCKIGKGTYVVSTAQPLGNLAAFLLEPESSDGLATWNFFDKTLKEGEDFPVLRLPAKTEVKTGKIAAVSEPERLIQVLIQTDKGDIEVALDAGRAPVTVANFLRYVDGKLYDGGRFHRTVTPDNQPDNKVKIEVIQAGLDAERSKEEFRHIALERTRDTHLAHKEGTISMARDGPDTASADFFICIGDQSELDFGGKRNPDGQGFAAFGKVVKGMDVVKKIQSAPSEGQNLQPPIRILKIKREE